MTDKDEGRQERQETDERPPEVPVTPDEWVEPEVVQPDDRDEVQEVYVVDLGVPRLSDRDIRRLPRLYPRYRWWQFWWWCRCRRHWWWRRRDKCQQRTSCCCCCCCGHGRDIAPVQPVQPSAPTPVPTPPPTPAPTIRLFQGTLAIGRAFYLLITPQGSRCQFVVQWNAAGGVCGDPCVACR